MFLFKLGSLLLVLSALGCAATRTDDSDPTPQAKSGSKSDIDTFTDLPYDSSGLAARKLDLYLPEGKKGEPLLIFIHGGAWIGGNKAMYSGFGNRFRKEGLAVALVNYRLSSNPQVRVKHPDHVIDTAIAYKWLVDQASKYGYNPSKIFVSGHSAGAHNAAMMATGKFLQDAGVPKNAMPAGFIGLEGIYDIPALNGKFPAYKDWFFTKAFGEETAWPAASPTLRPVVLKASWLVIQSTEDSLVDVTQAERFVDHLKEAHIKAEFFEEAVGDHDEVMRRLNRPNSDVAPLIFKFIGK